MSNRATAVFAFALLICMIPVAGLAQTVYVQDFESLPPVNGALSADGWLVYGNIFDPSGTTHLWNHGPWPAPNNTGNWEDIVTGEGGPTQELQQIVVYSDYGNADHGVGNRIESNLFQEQALPVGCSGTWYFTFDAKMGNLGGSSTALAFIKILNPFAGWSTTTYSQDMTNTPSSWTSYMISVDVTGLGGQILQFGFMSVASNYEPCGVFYDNVAFSPSGVVATENAYWGDVKSMFR